jgi:hypothetical protein
MVDNNIQMEGTVFDWQNIFINTYVADVPGGWLLRSVDTKNGLVESNENDNNGTINDIDSRGNLIAPENTRDNNDMKKIPLAMSSSMVFLNDPEHGWCFDKFRWYNIALDTWRAKVVGGWIIKCVNIKNIAYLDFDQISISSAMVFVADAVHTWNPIRPPRPLPQ